MSKGNNRITVQSPNNFSKAAEELQKKTEVIHISQEEISSRISEVIDWSLTKSESLDLDKNKIHIVTCNDGYTVQAFKYSGGRKVAKFSYRWMYSFHCCPFDFREHVFSWVCSLHF